MTLGFYIAKCELLLKSWIPPDCCFCLVLFFLLILGTKKPQYPVQCHFCCSAWGLVEDCTLGADLFGRLVESGKNAGFMKRSSKGLGKQYKFCFQLSRLSYTLGCRGSKIFCHWSRCMSTWDGPAFCLGMSCGAGALWSLLHPFMGWQWCSL